LDVVLAIGSTAPLLDGAGVAAAAVVVGAGVAAPAVVVAAAVSVDVSLETVFSEPQAAAPKARTSAVKPATSVRGGLSIARILAFQGLPTRCAMIQAVARARLNRLWTALPAILQTAFAAGVAWLVATELVGHKHPFMAVVSTIVALGLTYGQRTRRSLEITAGVAVGVLVADLIIVALGSGPLQIGLVVALAMSVAVLLGGTRLVVTQAATSAAIIATVVMPDHITLARFVDALVGGAWR
jgi:hypothetical protein